MFLIKLILEAFSVIGYMTLYLSAVLRLWSGDAEGAMVLAVLFVGISIFIHGAIDWEA